MQAAEGLVCLQTDRGSNTASTPLQADFRRRGSRHSCINATTPSSVEQNQASVSTTSPFSPPLASSGNTFEGLITDHTLNLFKATTASETFNARIERVVVWFEGFDAQLSISEATAVFG